MLYETPAINLYLAERHGTGSLAPATDDPDRGAFLSGLFYLTDELEPALKRYLYPQRFGVRASDETAIRKLSLDYIRQTLSVIDKRLSDAGPFHLRDRYSLVDLVLSFWMHSIMDKDAVSAFDAIHRCVRAVQERPVIRQLFIDLQARTKAYAEICLLYTSPSPRDRTRSRMPSSA